MDGHMDGMACRLNTAVCMQIIGFRLFPSDLGCSGVFQKSAEASEGARTNQDRVFSKNNLLSVSSQKIHTSVKLQLNKVNSVNHNNINNNQVNSRTTISIWLTQHIPRNT